MDVSPTGGGTIEVNQTIVDSYPTTMTFSSNESVNITAIPEPGYEFAVWGGSLSGNDNPTTVVMSCSKQIIATFYRPFYGLIIETNGSGSTNPHEGKYSYIKGTEISITATPDNDWQFDGWTGDEAKNESSTIVVRMDFDKIVVANFSQIMHTLTIDVDGNGFTTPAEGKYSYIKGTEISITATPDNGWQFDGWTGDTVDTRLSTTSLTLDSDMVVVASFSVGEEDSSKVEPLWWLIGGPAIGTIIIGGVVWLAVKRKQIIA